MFWVALAGLVTAALIYWAGDFVPRTFCGVGGQPQSQLHAPSPSPQPHHRTCLAERKSFWLRLVLQIGTPSLFVYLWERFGLGFNFYFFAFVSSYLILIALIDLRYRLIPNILIFPAALLVVVGGLYFLKTDLVTTLLGGLVGWVIFAGVAWLTPNGLGGGDVKLVTLIGFFFGFPHVLWALSIGVLLGGVGVISLLAARRAGRMSQIPYAPFLCVGAMIALLYNPFAT